MFKTALQLYSLRKQLETDLDGTLKKIAEAGYDGVETYTLHGLTACQLKDKFDGYNLKCVSMHVGFEQFRDGLDDVIGNAKTLGAESVVIPYLEINSETDVLNLVLFVKQNSEKVSAGGLKWLYHNHTQEFKKLEKGRDFFEILLESTDKAEINLQADTHWAETAGTPIAAFIEKYKDRIGGFHLKDRREVGEGNIDFATVLKCAKELGIEWLVVEQEEFDIDPFESIRISLDNIKRIL
jgi:sugar phosphate isomerase/epimerase